MPYEDLPTTKPWWVSNEAWERYQGAMTSGQKADILFNEYYKMYGAYGKTKWINEGMPDPVTAMTPHARDILERTGGVPRGAIVAPEPYGPETPTRERITREQDLVTQLGLGDQQQPTPIGKEMPSGVFQFVGEAIAEAQKQGEGYYADWDSSIGGYVVRRDPRYFEPEAQPSQAPVGYPQPEGAVPSGIHGRQATWNPRTGAWDYPPNWGVDPATLQAGYISPYQQQQLDLQQQQMQQQMQWYQMQQAEQERQYTSQLAAQPASWLQYASYTGEQPVILPWMQPLMPQQYGMGGGQGQTAQPNWGGGAPIDPSNLQLPRYGSNPPSQGISPYDGGGQATSSPLAVGQPIPGWTPEGGSAMPQLTSPSAQLWARMGPTAQQQYAAYRQARSGIRPEELLFRRGAQAPPGGRNVGLRWSR